MIASEYSTFFDYWHTHNHPERPVPSSRIEGIGRPRPELSFLREVIDHLIRVPDAGSLAAMRTLSDCIGRRFGGSTGTNFYGVLQIAAEMVAHGEVGSIVTLACDAGDRYLSTYYNDAWVATQGYDIEPYRARMDHCIATGQWT